MSISAFVVLGANNQLTEAFAAVCRVAGSLLAAFYRLYPSIGFAIVGLTVLVTVLTLPFTARATRSLASNAALRPEIERLRRKHRGDPERLRQALGELYAAHGVSPLGGCVPMLLQAPLLIVVVRVVEGLGHRGSQGFVPRYLSHHSRLYRALHGANRMPFGGLDLAAPGSAAFAMGGTALAMFIGLIAVSAAAGYLQQRLSSPGEGARPRVPLTAAIGPALVAAFGLVLPAAVTLYSATGACVRLVQVIMHRGGPPVA